MSLRVVRYQAPSQQPRAEVTVASPEAAITLLRTWQTDFPTDCGLLLDDQQRPIATTQPGTRRSQPAG